MQSLKRRVKPFLRRTFLSKCCAKTSAMRQETRASQLSLPIEATTQSGLFHLLILVDAMDFILDVHQNGKFLLYKSKPLLVLRLYRTYTLYRPRVYRF